MPDMSQGRFPTQAGVLRGYPPVAAWWIGHGVFLAALCDRFDPSLLGERAHRPFSSVYLRTASQNVYRLRRLSDSHLECVDARDGVPFEVLLGLTGSGGRGEISAELCVGEQACLGGRVITSTVVEIVALTDECIYRGGSIGSIRLVADMYTEGSLTLLPTEFQDRLSAVHAGIDGSDIESATEPE